MTPSVQPTPASLPPSHQPLPAGAAAQPGVLILRPEESADLDSTAVDCLSELRHSLQASGKSLLLARAKTTVRTLLHQVDPAGLGHESQLFWSVADAVQAAQRASSANAA